MSALRTSGRALSEGFGDVDRSVDPDLLIGYLDETRRLPHLKEVDRWLVRELRLMPGSLVLDIGCGTGEDTAELAALVAPGGRAVGVDASAVMVREARRRAKGRGLPLEFRLGRAEVLDLPDGSFDACRFERVLQHVASPLAALSEAARVLRPGGRLAAFEPDWTSLAIWGAAPEVTSLILETRSSTFASPDLGATLPQLLSEVGFDDLRSTEVSLLTRNLDVALRAFRLEAYAEVVVQGTAWIAALRAAERGGAFAARMTGYLVSGTRAVR